MVQAIAQLDGKLAGHTQRSRTAKAAMRRISPTVRLDRRLVKRMRRGDEAAFDQFANDFVAPLYRFALRRLRGDRDLTNDVVQSTLCKAIAKLQTYRGEATLITWLCAVCRNEIATHLRQRSRTVQDLDPTFERPAEDGLNPVLVSNPEASLLDRERTALVHDALDRLPPHYGRALEWKYVEGISVKAIANRLGLSPKATESLLTRARVSLRRELSGEFDPSASAQPVPPPTSR